MLSVQYIVQRLEKKNLVGGKARWTEIARPQKCDLLFVLGGGQEQAMSSVDQDAQIPFQ